MFTQEEVNRIVSERLARERAKYVLSDEELRTKELDARESKLKCRDYLEQHGLSLEILELYNTDSYDEFVEFTEKLCMFLEGAQELIQKDGNPLKTKPTIDGAMRTIFGLKRKD